MYVYRPKDLGMLIASHVQRKSCSMRNAALQTKKMNKEREHFSDAIRA